MIKNKCYRDKDLMNFFMVQCTFHQNNSLKTVQLLKPCTNPQTVDTDSGRTGDQLAHESDKQLPGPE